MFIGPFFNVFWCLKVIEKNTCVLVPGKMHERNWQQNAPRNLAIFFEDVSRERSFFRGFKSVANFVANFVANSARHSVRHSARHSVRHFCGVVCGAFCDAPFFERNCASCLPWTL